MKDNIIDKYITAFIIPNIIPSTLSYKFGVSSSKPIIRILSTKKINTYVTRQKFILSQGNTSSMGASLNKFAEKPCINFDIFINIGASLTKLKSILYIKNVANAVPNTFKISNSALLMPLK